MDKEIYIDRIDGEEFYNIPEPLTDKELEEEI